MRHKVSGKHLGRTSAHRRALRRNLAASLFEHGTISTTLEKAKFVRPFVEKLITLARNGSLHARRRVLALLSNRNICKIEDGEPVKVTTVVSKLFDEIGPRFRDRNGGYTRIIRLPLRRVGDNGKLAILQLVGEARADVKTPAKPVTGAPPETREPQPEKTAPKSEEAETEKTPLPPDQEMTEPEKMSEVIPDDTGEKPEDKSPAEQLADEKPSENDQSKKP